MRIRMIGNRRYPDFQAYCGKINGRKILFFAKTEEEAAAKGAAFIARYDKADGPIMSALSRRQSFDALNALEILASAGAGGETATLSEIAADFVGRRNAERRAPASGEDVRGLTLGELSRRFMESIDASRERHFKTHKSIISRLLKCVPPGTPADGLRPADFERFLAPYKEPVTRNSLLSRLKSFANWCVKKRLIAVSPVAEIEPSVTVYKEPAFFDPSKVERILRVAEREASDALEAGDDMARRRAASMGMFLTLGFLAGIRTSEIFRARWSEINLEEGFVRIPRPKGATSGARPRIAELESNAVSWVRFFRDISPCSEKKGQKCAPIKSCRASGASKNGSAQSSRLSRCRGATTRTTTSCATLTRPCTSRLSAIPAPPRSTSGTGVPLKNSTGITRAFIPTPPPRRIGKSFPQRNPRSTMPAQQPTLDNRRLTVGA